MAGRGFIAAQLATVHGNLCPLWCWGAGTREDTCSRWVRQQKKGDRVGEGGRGPGNYPGRVRER
jgi:hypothetical protein